MIDQAHSLRLAMIRLDSERLDLDRVRRELSDIVLQSRALTRCIAARNQAERKVLQRIEDRSGL